MFDLTGFQRDVLICASKLDRPSGQAIRETLEESTTRDSVTHGQLYPNLDTLVEQGLISRGEIDRRTNYYEVTNKGQRQIEQYTDWLQDSLAEA